MRYVALLRGIGPSNPNMRNDKLRGVLDGLGFGDVQTVISSGNVLFDSDDTDAASLEQRIEQAWPERLGFTSTTIIRDREQIEALVAADPFDGRTDTPTSKLNVTFLKHGPGRPFEVPYTSPAGDFTIVAITDRAVCSVADLTSTRTPEVMQWAERTFGKQITTRTWQTVHRIHKRMT